MKLIFKTMKEEGAGLWEREGEKNSSSRNYNAIKTWVPVDDCALWGLIGMSSNLILAGSWNIQRLLGNTKFLFLGVSQVINNVRMHALASPSLGH